MGDPVVSQKVSYGGGGDFPAPKNPLTPYTMALRRATESPPFDRLDHGLERLGMVSGEDGEFTSGVGPAGHVEGGPKRSTRGDSLLLEKPWNPEQRGQSQNSGMKCLAHGRFFGLCRSSYREFS